MDLPIQPIDIENTVFYQTFSQESMSDEGYMYKPMFNGKKHTVTFQLDDKTGNINVDFSKLQTKTAVDVLSITLSQSGQVTVDIWNNNDQVHKISSAEITAENQMVKDIYKKYDKNFLQTVYGKIIEKLQPSFFW